MGFAFGIVGETVTDSNRLRPQLDDWLCPAEADASVPTSASCYHVEEDTRVLAIVELAPLTAAKARQQIERAR